MSTADAIVAQAFSEQGHANVPARIQEIIDRHRLTLLNLATALLAAGRDEDEVVEVIHKASESFSFKLKSETEGLQS